MIIRAIFLCLAIFALPVSAATYTIDSSHTYANFEIDHMGFSTQRGLFRKTTGTVDFNPEARTGHIEIRIDAASLDTGFELRDNILRGEDWFKTAAFPDIFFRSQKLIFDQDRLVAVDGMLIMLGEARPMRLELKRFKCGFNLVVGKQGCGGDAQGVLLRSNYGLTNSLPLVGDEVRMNIQVEAYLP